MQWENSTLNRFVSDATLVAMTLKIGGVTDDLGVGQKFTGQKLAADG